MGAPVPSRRSDSASAQRHTRAPKHASQQAATEPAREGVDMHRLRITRPLPVITLVLGTMLPLIAAGPVLAAPETICGRVDAVTATNATVDGRTVTLAVLVADAVMRL